MSGSSSYHPPCHIVPGHAHVGPRCSTLRLSIASIIVKRAFRRMTSFVNRTLPTPSIGHSGVERLSCNVRVGHERREAPRPTSRH